MQLNDNEFGICNYPDDTTITISKKALEEWRNHYLKVAEECQYRSDTKGFYYDGKGDVLTDILKHFEKEG